MWLFQLGGDGTEDVVSHWGAADNSSYHPHLGGQIEGVEWSIWSKYAKEHRKGLNVCLKYMCMQKH